MAAPVEAKEERLDLIASDLKKIVKLLSALLTKDMSQKAQIQTLSSIAFTPKEIAELIGTTPNTVSVTLSALRRQKTGKAAGRIGE